MRTLTPYEAARAERVTPDLQPTPTEITFMLPYPPSVNAIWRPAGNRIISTDTARAYRQRCAEEIMVQKVPRHHRAIRGRLALHMLVITPASTRRRDLDNVLKATLDAIQRCGVIEDDESFDRILVERRPRSSNALDSYWDDGVVSLTIRVIEGGDGGAPR